VEQKDLKLRFYYLMISHGLHESKYLDLCKYYREIYSSPSVQADEHKWPPALRNALFFVVLAPYDNEQHDLLNRLSADEKLQTVGEC
jgi:26S proteasome regulatory subunit N5